MGAPAVWVRCWPPPWLIVYLLAGCLAWFSSLPTSYSPGSQKDKITKKKNQKDHPSPQKVKFSKKKSVFFNQKYHPSSQKTEVLSEKKLIIFLLIVFFLFFFWFFSLDRKKNGILFIIEAKKMKFCMKNLKSSYLWGFWKKISTPNFTKFFNP